MKAKAWHGTSLKLWLQSRNLSKMLPVLQFHLWQFPNWRGAGKECDPQLHYSTTFTRCICTHKWHLAVFNAKWWSSIITLLWGDQFLTFSWILPITNPFLIILLQERHKQLLAVGDIKCLKAEAVLCWLSNHPSKTLTQVKCLQKLWMKRSVPLPQGFIPVIIHPLLLGHHKKHFNTLQQNLSQVNQLMGRYKLRQKGGRDYQVNYTSS